MKNTMKRNMVLPLLLLLITLSSSVMAQRLTREQREEARERTLAIARAQARTNSATPAITHRIINIAPPHVVNFKQLADSQAAHPRAPRTGFIEQGEDKDADFKFVPHNIPAGTPTFDPDQLPGAARRNSPQHSRLSPAPLGYFLGTTGNGSLIPPDVSGAAGPTYVMETNNQQFDIYTKTGTLHSTLTIDNFFTGGTTGGYFDPHIIYDNIGQKFIVVIDGTIASNNDGGMFFAVSQTSDPTGNWWTYQIDNGDNNSNDLLDYEQLGYNHNWVVITANDFIGTSGVTEDIWVLNRTSMESGTLGTTHLFTDANSFSIAPAQTYDATEDTLWLVQNGNGASGAMQIGCITGTLANPAYNAGNYISVTSTWNDNAVDAGQKGGGTSQLVNSDDTRVGNGCAYINGKLWFTHAVWLPASGTATYSGVDWWQVSPQTLTVNQFGRIADPNGNTNYYYPSLNVNSNGDALLGYCLSGTDSFYPSAAYSFHAYTDAANVMESRYIYKPGVATYYQTLGGGRNRYGDYTGTMTDPVDGSFWNFSEWAQSATIWGTVIAHVGPTVPITNPPVASFTASATVLSCTGLVQFTDNSTNSPSSWLWNFGDGTTSTLQNPSHQYTANGTYTVSLKATNAYGNNTATITSYITVSLPAGPTAANVSHCGSSTFSLSAATTNPVAWFDSTGTFVSSANPYVTPLLTRTSKYYVMDTVLAPIDSVGPATYSTLGAGASFTATNQHYLTFDALAPFTLISVVVNASTTGVRTIQVLNSGGTVIATASPTINSGVSTVTLNFSIPAGTGYQLSCSGNVSLYRNNAVPGGSYPFTVPGVVSITGSDAGAGYYYYFYNWKVRGQSCLSSRTAVLATVYPGGLTATPTPTAVACYGGTTGAIALATSGGTANYTYHWSGGQTTSSITGVAAGTYTVTITDANSCTSTVTSTVTQPAAALAIAGTVTNPSCTSANSGSVAATVTGGTSTYTYSWSTTPRQTTATATNLAAGSYTVTVTDAHSCTATHTFTVAAASGGITLNTNAVNASCGTSNGTATVSVTGTGTFTYHWSSGATTATATGLAAGTYTVTVNASGGCSATATASVSSTGGATTTINGVNTTCGSNNGSATVHVTSGTGPYTYTWSGSSSVDSVATGLAAGNYTVTVRDGNGCSSISSVSVTASNPLSITPSSVNATCGNSNGSATATVSGASTYSWSSGATTATASNLAPGTYTVTVTGGGCTATASVSVSNTNNLTVSPTATATTCGSNNGSATVSITGATYSWSNSGTTQTISGLAAGTYTVTVNSNGCTATASVSVGASNAVQVQTSSTAATCSGGGTATATITNPINPVYHWSNGGTTATIAGVAAGTYTVTVTSNGCTATASQTVNPASGSVSVAATAHTEVSCFGQSNGSITVAASGGTPNYTYHWNTGLTTATITGLAAGTYTVTAQDAGGCQASQTITITQPTAITIGETSTEVSCPGHADGTITLSVSGGTPNYGYAWATGQTTPAITGLAAGSYNVTVTDNNSCTNNATISIASLPAVSATVAVTQPPHTGQTGSAIITNVTGGTGPYTATWSNGTVGDTVTGLIPGNYTVTVTDAHGCTQTDTVRINKISGINNVDGGINFNVYPNPAHNEVVVDLQNTYNDAVVTLRDILGQTLISQPITGSSITLNLTPFTTGVYFVEVSQNVNHSVRKLIINQ